MEKQYEYLKVVGSTSSLLSNIEELDKKFEINFDPKIKKEDVYSFSKTTNGRIGFKILEVVKGANISDLLEDACGGDFGYFAFDTLLTVLDTADCNQSLLSKKEKNNLFIFGCEKKFFLARVFKAKRGIVVYVSLTNFDLPLNLDLFDEDCKHQIFLRK